MLIGKPMTLKLILQIVSIVVGMLLGGGGLVTSGTAAYNYGFYDEAPDSSGISWIATLLGSGGILTVVAPILLQYLWPKADPTLWKQVSEAITAIKEFGLNPTDHKKMYLAALECLDVIFAIISSVDSDEAIRQKLLEISKLLHDKLGPGTFSVVTPPPLPPTTSRRHR